MLLLHAVCDREVAMSFRWVKSSCKSGVTFLLLVLLIYFLLETFLLNFTRFRTSYWNRITDSSVVAEMTDTNCVWPLFDNKHQFLKPYTRHPGPATCKPIQPTLFKLKKGKLYAVDKVLFKKSTCFYRELSGYLEPKYTKAVYGPYIRINKSGEEVTLSSFVVSCFANPTVGRLEQHLDEKESIYREAFAQIGNPTNPISTRHPTETTRSSVDRLSVHILVLDSVSVTQFLRQMPKTMAIMKRQGFVTFRKPAKVADNTLVNVMPLLTGKHFIQPHSIILDNETTKDFDLMNNKSLPIRMDDIEFLWNKFSEMGCATMLNVNPVLRGYGFGFYPKVWLHGFERQPTDYYFRPFYNFYVYKQGWISRPLRNVTTKYCLGNRPEHQVTFQLAEEWATRFKGKCSFALHLALHAYTHDSPYDVTRLDATLANFFKTTASIAAFNHTVFLLLGDHGQRLHQSKYSYLGQIEERTAFFSFLFPPWFPKKYPTAWRNLMANRHRMIAHYDVHETLLSVIRNDFNLWSDVTTSSTKDGRKSYGFTLFAPVPDRNCSEARTPPQFCICLRPFRESEIENGSVIRTEAERLLKQVLGEDDKTFRRLAVEISYFTEQMISFEEASDISTKQPSQVWVSLLLGLFNSSELPVQQKTVLISLVKWSTLNNRFLCVLVAWNS